VVRCRRRLFAMVNRIVEERMIHVLCVVCVYRKNATISRHNLNIDARFLCEQNSLY
jgi:hypothetical protein